MKMKIDEEAHKSTALTNETTLLLENRTSLSATIQLLTNQLDIARLNIPSLVECQKTLVAATADQLRTLDEETESLRAHHAHLTALEATSKRYLGTGVMTQYSVLWRERELRAQAIGEHKQLLTEVKHQQLQNLSLRTRKEQLQAQADAILAERTATQAQVDAIQEAQFAIQDVSIIQSWVVHAGKCRHCFTCIRNVVDEQSAHSA